METQLSLTPLLVVRDAATAIQFYVDALGAKELVRCVNRPLNTVGHADLSLGNSTFSITEELRAFNSDAPPSLGGSPVVLQLQVDDVETLLARMCQAGAHLVLPLQEFCGEPMARLRDPWGHLWIISECLELLSPAEKQQRRDTLLSKLASPETTMKRP
ncbi:VOC family protein [Myxococcota bacterium]